MMVKSFRRIAIDSLTDEEIKEHREKLKSAGILDFRLLSDTKVIRFMAEKSKRNKNLINLEDLLKILQG